MSRFRHAICTVLLVAIIVIAGCAYPPRATDDFYGQTAVWRGRLALRVEPDSAPEQGQPAAHSFSAGFELSGNAQTGELLLFSPLGSTIAALNWTPQTAAMRANGESRLFDSLDALVQQATGTQIPIASLFAWLAGENLATQGWQADLSQFPAGRVLARRSNPPPAIELRLIIEK